MPLFKTNLKRAWTESKHAMDVKLQHFMPLPPAREFAAELMQAFGAGGPKPGKPLTHRDLAEWLLDRYEFPSRGLRAVAYGKLDAPLREALQILEHAELVYLTVRSERPDTWTATSSGLEALARGKDAVSHSVLHRSNADAPSRAQRLQELQSLHSSGTISDAEYAAKRERILNEI